MRAALLYKKGEVRRPLRLLRLGSFFIPAAKTLRGRLEGVNDYLYNGKVHLNDEGGRCEYTHKNFNGAVLFAFHSCGYFHPSGYSSRSTSLLTALVGSGIRPTAVLRLGYPWDISRDKVEVAIRHVDYEGHIYHLCEGGRVNLNAPEDEYIEKYSQWIVENGRLNDVSVLHASSNYLNGLAVAQAGRLSGVRTVYELRGLWHITKAFADPCYEESEHYRYVEKREIEACRLVDRVVTLSGAMKRWLISRGIAEDKITVIGNATHEPRIVDEREARRKVRAKYHISEDELVIGYIGSLVGYEGLDLLLKGLQRVPEAERPLLLFIGGGKAEDELRRMAIRLGVGNRVLFGGRVSADQVSSHYMAMDIVALPRKDHDLTRLVPAIKPYEVVGHRRRLFVSSALASAIEDTLDTASYSVVNFESPECVKELLREADANIKYAKVPTWDDRAGELTSLYDSLF